VEENNDKKYFVWAPPASGKSQMTENYSNVQDHDVHTYLISIPGNIKSMAKYHEGKNVLVSPFAWQARDYKDQKDFEEALELKSKKDAQLKSENGIEYETIIAIPSKDQWDEYAKRIVARGQEEQEGDWVERYAKAFMEDIDWVNKNREVFKKHNIRVIDIKPNQFLSDTLTENGIDLLK